MPRTDLICAILFADISGSTNLYETLGDKDAHTLVSACITVLERVIAEHRGTIVKTIGDEVMGTFAGAGEAVQAAIGMQKALDAMPAILPGQRIKPNIRVGLHIGPVIRQDDDVFGDAVNVAARMVSQAKPRQIITTQATVEALPEDADVSATCVDRTTVKGKGGEISLYEIVWEQETQTLILSREASRATLEGRLQVSLGDKALWVDRNKPAITLGRQEQNDLVVNDSIASRVHARIEYHRGKFVLIDQSTNGTYVQAEGTSPVFLHHDECVLGPRGTIGLGREADKAAPDVIRFVHECQGDV